MDTRMKATIAAVSSTFLIIIVSLTGAIRRKDTCNFDDGLCGWVQGEADNFNWTRISGNGSTINTGPKSGHTTGNSTDDYYMYFNALQQKEGARAVLQRNGFDHAGRACLSFWYHMYGSHMGTLNINVSKNGDSPNLVWSKTGSQSVNWTHAAVDLEIGSNATIEFEAIRGNGTFGNMALDDVSLTYESCFNCAFDDDFCLWEETKDWKFSPNEAKSGRYATMVVPQGCVPRNGHILSTPVHAMQGPVCISFLYFLNGSENRLQLYIGQDSDSLIGKVSSNSTWNIFSTFVNESSPNFTLVFEMYPGPSCLGEAGLKNISVVMGKCRGSTVINKTTYPHLGVSEFQTTSSADFSHEIDYTKISGSTVINKTTYPHLGVSEFQTTSSADFSHEIDYTKISVAAIIGLVVGSLVLVVVLAIVAICIFRKRRQKKKNTDLIEYQTVSSKLSGTVRNVETRSNAEHSVNTGFTHSPNISYTNDTSNVIVKVAMENYSYVTSFVAKPTHGTDSTYDTTWIETRPCFDGTYDHVTTHYNDLRNKSYESDVSCSKSDANQAYDHVTKSPEGVYDKTYVTTQGADGRDNAYDPVTIGTCQTPVHISINRY